MYVYNIGYCNVDHFLKLFGASDGSEETKHWRGKRLFVNNDLHRPSMLCLLITFRRVRLNNCIITGNWKSRRAKFVLKCTTGHAFHVYLNYVNVL